MINTRSRSHRLSSARRSYRRRVRGSHCRRKGPVVCRATRGCKYASGKKRSFCRKTRITRRRRKGGTKGRQRGGDGQLVQMNSGSPLSRSLRAF